MNSVVLRICWLKNREFVYKFGNIGPRTRSCVSDRPLIQLFAILQNATICASTSEFTDDRPRAKAFDPRRIRLPDRSRDYLARPQNTGATSGEADRPWLRHRDRQGPRRHRRRPDPDYRKRMSAVTSARAIRFCDADGCPHLR